MFQFLLRWYYRIRPKWLGWCFKLLFANSNLKIGRNFQCDTFPKLLLDKSAKIQIGDGVLLRRNVELRAHGQSEINIGDRCRIDRGVRILSANEASIELEDGVRIGLYSVFNGGDSIFVGEKSLISGFVYIQTSMHNYKGEGTIQSQGYSHAPVHLGKDSWLGTHAVIFPGVRLGDKCVVGSSSIVNQSFPAHSVVAGIPAKVLKNRE